MIAIKISTMFAYNSVVQCTGNINQPGLTASANLDASVQVTGDVTFNATISGTLIPLDVTNLDVGFNGNADIDATLSFSNFGTVSVSQTEDCVTHLSSLMPLAQHDYRSDSALARQPYHHSFHS